MSLNLTPQKPSEKTRELEAKAPLLEAAGKMPLPHFPPSNYSIITVVVSGECMR